MFPSKIVTDFVSKNVIFLAYNIEDGVGKELYKKYSGRSIPTMIFIDEEGVEFMRTPCGDMTDIKSFINGIERALKPENSLIERENRYKNDPSYTLEYLTFLSSNGMTERACELIEEVFKRDNSNQFFTPEWILYYNMYVIQQKTPILKFISSHSKEAMETMGREPYAVFMKDMSINLLSYACYSEGGKDIEPLLAVIKKNPVMKTGFSEFVTKNIDCIKDRDKNAQTLLSAIENGTKNIGTKSRESILSLITPFIFMNDSPYNSEAIRVYEKAISYEKDNVLRQQYKKMIISFKNKP